VAAEGELSEADMQFRRFVLVQLFTPPLVRHMLVCIGMSIGGLFAFWAVTTWVPQIVRTLMAAQGITGNDVIPYVTWSNLVLNAGGVVGYASWGFIADKIGRKPALLMSFLVSLISIWVLFPFQNTFTAYMLLLPVVGFGIFGFFAGSAVYFPEVFATHVRTTAVSLANNVGRLITSPGPFVAGLLVDQVELASLDDRPGGAPARGWSEPRQRLACLRFYASRHQFDHACRELGLIRRADPRTAAVALYVLAKSFADYARMTRSLPAWRPS
jgi:MFS family permease